MKKNSVLAKLQSKQKDLSVKPAACRSQGFSTIDVTKNFNSIFKGVVVKKGPGKRELLQQIYSVLDDGDFAVEVFGEKKPDFKALTNDQVERLYNKAVKIVTEWKSKANA